MKKAPLILPKDWETTIVLPAPPHHRSARTQAEIEYLAELQGKRTPADEALISGEADGIGWRFGKHRFADLLGGAKGPKTKDLVIAAMEDFSPVIFQMKKKYDRVRPSFLNPRLKPSMEVPGHPAYPSGHASQAFFIAYLLAELDPPNQEVYLTDATAIAKRREIAGFHYPSDTAAGALLARQVLDLLLEQKQFRGLLEKARAEWEPKRPSI